MSILIPSKNVFNYIHSGLERAAYRNECDEWYSQVIRSHFRHKDIDKESRRLIESWQELNLLSYNIKYQQNTAETITKFRPTFTHKEMEVNQLLKYVQCVQYNIEPGTIEDLMEMTSQQKDDLKLLQEWEIDIAGAIVNQLPEYKKATWCE